MSSGEEAELRRYDWLKGLSFGLIATAMTVGSASAQVTPAAGYTPPDDTPVIRVGATLFANYSYQTEPEATDAAGNSINRNSFEVARAYINITGNVSHIIAFRITPDVLRESACPSATCSAAGNLIFRTKYAYLQTNLDDWMARGSYARFGIQQTPYLDSLESIYRYRFQGTLFAERTNYFKSADAGASFRYNFPQNYGDLHVGVYNGENYDRPEPNDQKATMFRATVRPLPTGAPILRGVKGTVYWVNDNYVKNSPRDRFMFNVTFEHPYVNAAFEYLDAKDQTLPTNPRVESSGYSIWLTPKMGPNSTGLEGLIRYDHLTPNESDLLESQKQNRLIVGAAYWFPHPGGAPTTAIMVDYDGQMFKNITATKPTKVIAVHALVNF